MRKGGFFGILGSVSGSDRVFVREESVRGGFDTVPERWDPGFALVVDPSSV